jgi:AbrB family looped-hinge helix DNA binding protein
MFSPEYRDNMRSEPVIGSAKVGSRGQIVLPIEIRKRCGIGEGDTMIVMARPGPGGWSVALIKASEMTDILEKMESTKTKIRSLIRSNSDK